MRCTFLPWLIQSPAGNWDKAPASLAVGSFGSSIILNLGFMKERRGRMEFLPIIITHLLWAFRHSLPYSFSPTVKAKSFDLDWGILNILKSQFPPLNLDGTLGDCHFKKANQLTLSSIIPFRLRRAKDGGPGVKVEDISGTLWITRQWSLKYLNSAHPHTTSKTHRCGWWLFVLCLGCYTVSIKILQDAFAQAILCFSIVAAGGEWGVSKQLPPPRLPSVFCLFCF